MQRPFFSIIIPTLNEEKYLPRLLSDLTLQSERDFEVFIADAGSHDQTPTVAQSFSKRLPLVFITSDKKNVSIQRNLGARQARGTYLMFLDADVQVPSNFLQLIKRHLQKHFPDMLTTYLKADSRSLSDQMIARVSSLLQEMSLKLIELPFVIGFNFTIKREVFLKAGGFRKDVKHGEDIELSQRLFKSGKTLEILKQPKLIFSLRRYREEGRLNVLRKNAKAAFHILTRGPITKELFDYPMGGDWYRKKQHPSNGLEKAETFVKNMVKLLFE